MKFDIDVNESRINACSTMDINGAEVRINVSLPWLLLMPTTVNREVSPTPAQQTILEFPETTEVPNNG